MSCLSPRNCFVKIGFISFCIIPFRFDSVNFVSFRWISFRLGIFRFAFHRYPVLCYSLTIIYCCQVQNYIYWIKSTENDHKHHHKIWKSIEKRRQHASAYLSRKIFATSAIGTRFVDPPFFNFFLIHHLCGTFSL